MPSERYKKVQQSVQNFIDRNVWLASFFGIIVLSNIFMFIVELDVDFFTKYEIYFDLLEYISMIAFTADYCIRVWACTSQEKYQSPVKGRLRFMVTPLMIADLLPLVHFYMWAFQLPQYIPLNVIIFRIFRLFRLNHVTDIVQRRQTFFEIFEGSGKSKYHTGFALFIAFLIIFDISAVSIELVDPLVYDAYKMELRMIEYFTLFVFTFEYVVRIWVCTLDPRYAQPLKGRLKYMATPLSIIDLLTIIPFYIPLFIPFEIVVLRAFRLIRLFRVLKFARFRKKSNEKVDKSTSMEGKIEILIEPVKALIGMIKVERMVNIARAAELLRIPPNDVRVLLYILAANDGIKGEFEGDTFRITSDIDQFVSTLNQQFRLPDVNHTQNSRKNS